MFQAKVVDKIKTNFLCSIPPPLPPENSAVYNVQKYCRAGQATDDNMAYARCMLVTW